jgi:hypothetical protein
VSCRCGHPPSPIISCDSFPLSQQWINLCMNQYRRFFTVTLRNKEGSRAVEKLPSKSIAQFFQRNIRTNTTLSDRTP